MALPINGFLAPSMPAPWVGAGDNPAISRLYDAEDGPVAIQDPSRGLNFQEWRAYALDGVVMLEADNVAPTILLNDAEQHITDISIAFDQNANLYFAWADRSTSNGYLNWYNPTIPGREVIGLGQAMTPKLTLDDRRPTARSRSDVILFYIVGGLRDLCYRQQRDKFLYERRLSIGPWRSIERAYMNRGLRMQFILTKGDWL